MMFKYFVRRPVETGYETPGNKISGPTRSVKRRSMFGRVMTRLGGPDSVELSTRSLDPGEDLSRSHSVEKSGRTPSTLRKERLTRSWGRRRITSSLKSEGRKRSITSLINIKIKVFFG